MTNHASRFTKGQVMNIDSAANSSVFPSSHLRAVEHFGRA